MTLRRVPRKSPIVATHLLADVCKRSGGRLRFMLPVEFGGPPESDQPIARGSRTPFGLITKNREHEQFESQSGDSNRRIQRIRRGIATALGAAGARVIVNYCSDKEGAQRVTQTIIGSGGEAIAVAADVARLFKDVDTTFERLDDWARMPGCSLLRPSRILPKRISTS